MGYYEYYDGVCCKKLLCCGCPEMDSCTRKKVDALNLYHDSLNLIREKVGSVLNLPEDVKKILSSVSDLETKAVMLYEISKNL